MPLPNVMLGGVPIVLHAGAPAQQFSPLGGPEIVRLSGGVGVPMTHWSRTAIGISGTGWMPPGLDGLDYSQPLELRCTKPQSIVGAHTSFVLTSAPRPDFAPWAEALVGADWVSTPVSLGGLSATVTPVAGATLYRVCWMPVFIVSAKPAQGDLDSSTNTHSWRIDCEEL